MLECGFDVRRLAEEDEVVYAETEVKGRFAFDNGAVEDTWCVGERLET